MPELGQRHGEGQTRDLQGQINGEAKRKRRQRTDDGKQSGWSEQREGQCGWWSVETRFISKHSAKHVPSTAGRRGGAAARRRRLSHVSSSPPRAENAVQVMRRFAADGFGGVDHRYIHLAVQHASALGLTAPVRPIPAKRTATNERGDLLDDDSAHW